MELNNTLRQKEQELVVKEGQLQDLTIDKESVDKVCQSHEQTIMELDATLQLVKDEFQALQLACTALEEKHRKVQEENQDLNTTGKAAESSSRRSKRSTCKHTKDAHDSEVNAATFSMSGRLFVTGGADRRVKVWEQVNGNYTLKGTMHGSNAGIMSVQIDPQHTLTGHSQKVMSAKFFGAATKVVSGGHDRTLKIWDLRSRVCTRTIFAGSSCNDIVINDGIGSQVASGHLDKTVRFWDVRSENQSSVGEITLQGKITSLDLSPDMNYMLASARDDTVKLLDLRMNQVMSTCSADGFKVAMDYTRASFSPDGQYVICGSHDGSIFVWSATTAKLDKTLKEHSSSVVVCAWHPDGSSIISCDRNKRAIIWTNRY
ncbi:hypothetical protein OS493_010284 [Desmophyllum pertusum]|uniref:Autophagy-related protein 16 domain-containing protein n=1 Tax=Desmophyllum pertusum TaxID=174260 RepID=A0A9X0A402_9CNID|nr:hypothetical protein OS493_010284 [Desmophyllum pertusum]